MILIIFVKGLRSYSNVTHTLLYQTNIYYIQSKKIFLYVTFKKCFSLEIIQGPVAMQIMSRVI